MAKELPKYVIIQSDDNNRYLHVDTEYPNLPNALRFEGEYSFGLETRFEVVPSTTRNGLVHIRSLLNNKYWATSGGNSWITAMAAKPEENQSEKHCRLFQPVFLYSTSNSNIVARLRHVNTGNYVRRYYGNSDTGDFLGCLTLLPKMQPDDNTVDMCTFIDWDSVVMLPDLIRIKFKESQSHAKAFADGYMDLRSRADNSSIYDFEVLPSRDGGIRLKSTQFGTYWTDMQPNSWVCLTQASPTVHETNTVFLPTTLDGNLVAMRCLKNGLFCKRYSGYGKDSCIATHHTYPDEFSYMEIEEPVFTRTISNGIYHLTDARRYDERTVALISDDQSNGTQRPQTSQLNLKTTFTKTTNLSNSTTWKGGVKVTGSFGVPKIASGSLDISVEHTRSWNWGEMVSERTHVGSIRTVVVSPMSRVKASLVATRCSYDIPFSYTQRDFLKNGSIKVYNKKDGLLSGTDGYDFKYDLVELSLK
ncbi:uncharacterized protein LOC113327987 [Papaver somniferum]|uniref:uncharacterized protein LOC113327987 n=1 Tax=Papaver somniferum TaxID=3469 RepID=UPI000E6FE2BE|nr:uncharacterized protein LOC113327987 [Papaver somniferum]